jgi:predicted XRE-type DNA-binding protein
MMKNSTNLHTGSSFDSFLEEEGILDEVKAVAAKRVIAWQLSNEMVQQHITKQAMAAALHTSRSQIDRLLDPENASVYLTTLARAAHAVGMHIEIGLVRDDSRSGHGRARLPVTQAPTAKPRARAKRSMEHA